jgi:GT2 family glycosyltransferase
LNPDVSVAIINWNTRDLLRNCLASLDQNRPACHSETLVVDNASTDGSVEMVTAEFPQAMVIHNQSNHGYARAANQAIAKSRGHYIFVLNSDTEVSSGVLDSLLSLAESDLKIGAIGPRLINSDGSLQLSCRRFPSLTSGIGHAIFSLFSADNPYTRQYRLTDWNHAEATEVDWVSGAALFLRREAAFQIGLFDEEYFMYVEDLDLCYRLHQAGWKVHYAPSAAVMHHVGQSSVLRSPQMVMEHHRSLYRFISKNSRGYLRLLNLPIGAGLMARGSLVAGAEVAKKIFLGRRFGKSKEQQ